MRFYNHSFWLLTITGLLIAFNWYLLDYNSIYLIYWCAALYITWIRKDKIDLESNIFSTIIGLLLISWLLFRGVVANNDTDFIARMYPLFSVFGILLLSTQFNKIYQYWREIIIVGLTGIPWEHIFAIFSLTSRLSIIDAKIARLVLWYIGFDVAQKDNFVILPTGSIKIAGACSSLDLLGLMWQFCLVIFLCFTITKNQKLFLSLWATIIALGVNSIRLCLMALLVANQKQEAFDYWHGSSGAEIFTTIAILLLALGYWFFVDNREKVIGNRK